MKLTPSFQAYDLFLGVIVPNELADTQEERKDLPLDFFKTFMSQLGDRKLSDVAAGRSRYEASQSPSSEPFSQAATT